MAVHSGTIDNSQPQAVLSEFLQAGGLGEPVERVDTHGAVVFLGRTLAWKMKRAVRFSFMDLSTLKRREGAIRAELEQNRRTAPELYLRVVPVSRTAKGGFALDGPGDAVEWLLEMVRYPAEAQLDRIALGGHLTPGIIDRLAETVSDAHVAAARHQSESAAEAMRDVMIENAADLERSVPAVFERSMVEALTRATAAELERQSDLLDARGRAGKVRRCHADLHLGNVVLLDGQPVLIDCLEFSEKLATIDVLYDLAFLIMDMLDRSLDAQAWRLLQAYNNRRIEDAGLALLPLFLSVRATIRAKVSAFSADQQDQVGGRLVLTHAAQHYLALAHRILEVAPARLVALGGRSGTGKSTLAIAVAPQIGATPGAVILRSDLIRKRMLGRAVVERLPERAYDPQVTRKVYQHMIERAGVLLRAGRSVICDAVYADNADRLALADLAAGVGVSFRGFWLEAPEEVLEERVAGRVDDVSDADVAVVHKQREHVRCDTPGWQRVPTDRPLAATLSTILVDLRAE